MKKRIVFYICLFQIIVIVSLLVSIQKHTKILGNVSVNSINKDDIVFDSSGGLKYFFEPNRFRKPEDNLFSSVNETEGITINADTLNERFEYLVPKPKDVLRVITLGDSWTYGLHVPTNKNWTELLEDKYKAGCSNKIEVVNLGVAGYDTRYELERFIKRGVKYEPDVVIWFFIDLRRYMEDLVPLFHERISNRDLTIPELFGGIEEEVIANRGLQNIYNYQVESIKKFQDYHKGKLLIVAEPVFVNSEERGILKKYVNEAGDFSSYYELEHSPNLNTSKFAIPNDGHPNELGHELIAQDLYQETVEEAIVRCDG